MEKYEINRVDGGAYVRLSIVPISRLVKVSPFLLTLSPSPREDLVFLGGMELWIFRRYFIDLRDEFLVYYFFFSSPESYLLKFDREISVKL